ncbi:MAG: oligosaccharide flippase family protein [Spongiibacteraceae bacterium]
MLDRNLRSNALSLLAQQAVTLLLPLLLLPYLLRSLGVSQFGVVVFSQSVVGYFVILVEYGFNLSATQSIAQVASDSIRREKIFWATWWARLLLCIVGAMLLYVLLMIVPLLTENADVIAASYIQVVGVAILPHWYFLGLERAKPIAVFNIAGRILSTAAVVVCILFNGPLWGVAMALSSAQIISAVPALFYLVRCGLLTKSLFSFREVFNALKNGWKVFVSTAAVSLYSVTNNVVLGFVGGGGRCGSVFRCG